MLRSRPGQKGMAHPRNSLVSNDPIKNGRKGWGSPLRRLRTEISHRARWSDRRVDFSTTLRAKGERADGSDMRS
ncbi:hypothetical protein HanIR_Chr07g0329271 [Helianthus annuus]|nr:hypothetical protein HanIR_Chr07g0329271 [Helianthus annuus]